MNFDPLYYFLVSFIVTFVLMPFGLRIIRNLNFVDKPNPRKVHNLETPTGGGVIVFIGILISLLVFSFNFSQYLTLSLSYFLGLLIIFIMGLMDDKNDLSPKVKLITQIISATIFIALSKQFIMLDFIDNKFISILLTIFFIISVINAYNLIDGLDGLASGLAIITISSLVLLLDSDFKMIFYSIIGILFAFLRRNSYPAKIFLGDTGSYMLGYSVAVLGVLIVNQSLDYSLHSIYHILAVIFCIGLPIIDTAYAFLRRLWHKENIFKADKKHIHHTLLSYNLSHKDSVSMLYIIQSVLAIFSLYLIGFEFSNIYLIIICLFVIKHIFTIYNIKPISFSFIFSRFALLNKAYIYFFFSIIILLNLLSIQNSQTLFDFNLLYICLLVLFINLLFVLDKRTRKNNNIDISILFSSVIMLYFCFTSAGYTDNENWIYIIKNYIWYPISFGIILSLFGIFKEKNDLFESPTEYLILFYVAIIMPITITSSVHLFFLKAILILLIYKIILQDKVIREFNVIHFMNIFILFFLILYNI